ncbi:FAD-dependent monooxygenase [bacterium]|nr:FAD-dependent monooxygenase [bacterium]
MKPMHIAIVGYGTAGQASAIFLARAGHQVEVFERSPALKPLGAGLLLQPTGLSVLRELGLETQALALGARIDALIGVNQNQRKIMDMRYSELQADFFGLGMQRGALFELLKSADANASQVRTGMCITGIDRARNTLSDIDGKSFGPFDLIILADGAHSQLRAHFPDLLRLDRAYPWGAVWCLLEERRTAADIGRSQLLQRYGGALQMCGLLPVGRLTSISEPAGSAATEKVCVFWSLEVHRWPEWEFHGLGNWRSAVHELWPEVADMLLQIQHPREIAKASYRDVRLARKFSDRVVFLGDCGHSMSPQLGQGANMALLDAQALAAALSHHQVLSIALAEYDQRRQAHVRMYQRLSRWLTPLFQSNSSLAAWLRDLSFYPVSRLPGLRYQSLKVLAGLQKGWFGRFP